MKPLQLYLNNNNLGTETTAENGRTSATTEADGLWSNGHQGSSRRSHFHLNEPDSADCRQHGLSINLFKDGVQNKKSPLTQFYRRMTKKKSMTSADRSLAIDMSNSIPPTIASAEQISQSLTSFGYLELLNSNNHFTVDDSSENQPPANDCPPKNGNEKSIDSGGKGSRLLRSLLRMRIRTGKFFNKKHTQDVVPKSVEKESEPVPGPSEPSSKSSLFTSIARIRENKKARTRKSSKNATFCPFSQSINSSDEDDVLGNMSSALVLDNKRVSTFADAMVISVCEVLANPDLGTPSERAAMAIHSTVEYKNVLVPDLVKITAASYYWGMMDRYEAENLLDGKPEGMFLLRDSAQINYLFSVSFRRYTRTLHARVEYLNGEYSFDMHDEKSFKSRSISDLIEHFKDPKVCWLYEPQLSIPLERPFVFSLKHLCRAAIVTNTSYEKVSTLPLPPMLKKYLREYHYKEPIKITEHDI